MAEQENGSSPACRGAGRVGGRWTLLVVEALLAGRSGSMTCPARSPGSQPARAHEHRAEHPVRAPFDSTRAGLVPKGRCHGRVTGSRCRAWKSGRAC